ncbi:hypothetical protein [Rhodopseudomonas palustris]|uniref:Alpha/beta hydrolase n=1 Tax=Rhodopseudomonas palustris (strain ATCC BAA-98 / CGA009) TaxID=258594 RepID=A0AAF0BJV5_RHOPA|nr:hypothetical protein [Rhodopseudomonas palustris]OPF94593.1 hypothetical protein B1S06_07800 [Rhodopseudomonas palustris]PPQ44847.1 hypothetical protein CKO39_03890 [Rhodopseudomonas palustris]QQM02038.1 hypothetical protein I8G32_00561 [Rhodopseudomonas palustris]RJF63462.1 hypothetical protein D4Q71_15090 [Rhodopseudomonas palustris]WAB78245.1 hypothetical protein OR798_02795 [Rhodopseudomonas palustris]
MRLVSGIQDHCDVRGLLDHDEYSGEFSRLLCVAQNEGVSFSECVAAAKLIRSSNGPGWRQAWEELARSHVQRAEEARRTGNEPEAQKSWLHAANYFMAAAIESCPEGAEPALGALARSCLHNYLAHLTPQGETVAIPWLEPRSLEGFYLPVGTYSAETGPVVVCIAETRRTKEEILSLVLRSARKRGMTLLCVDLPDEPPSSRAGPETGIPAILDYLIDGRGIDAKRIAVISDGSPSSLVTRGIALDGRIAAAVCDGGLWDLWVARQTEACGAALGMVQGCARRPAVSCPMLVPLLASEGIEPGHARQLLTEHHPGNRDILLKVFGETSSGPWTLNGYDPILVADFVFDWVGQQLKAATGDADCIRRLESRL